MSEFEQKQKDMAELAVLEERLRRELERVEAPAGFAERVMERAAKEPVRMPARRWAMFAVAAALLVCTVLGGQWGYRVQQERKRARAEAEFQAAVRVTDMTLKHMQEQLQRAGVNLNFAE